MSKKRTGARKAKFNSMKQSGYRQDSYFHKAKQENYASRAVYKLEQIDKRFRVFNSGARVLDLGCAPGSWSQYAAKKTGASGFVVGVDLLPVTAVVPHAEFVQGDIYELSLDPELFPEHGFDVVMSDMAPNTSGVKKLDQLRSASLVEEALRLALIYLRPGGHFVAKIFMGPDEPAVFEQMVATFNKAVRYKPEASRSESMELYLVGLGLKEGA